MFINTIIKEMDGPIYCGQMRCVNVDVYFEIILY